MDKILTVAIPCYNVEKYIEETLSSFVCDEETMAKLEVLVINDGSTDNTRQEAEVFQDNWPDTFRVINKPNGGHGSGINAGIKNATGKYFKIVDGDDWVQTENLKGFIELLETINSDLVSNDFTMFEDETNRILGVRKACSDDSHYGKEWNFVQVADENLALLHSITYRTELLKEHDIQVDEGTFYEDIEFDLYPIPFCNTVYYDERNIYMYRMGRSGQSVDVQSMIKRKSQHEGVINSLLKFYDENQFGQKGKRHYIDRGLVFILENQFQIYLAMGTEEAKAEMIVFDRNLKENYKDVYDAFEKKSIWMLRQTNYKIFKLGALIYKIVK